MLEDLRLRGRSDRTIETYLRSVRLLEEHFDKGADAITEGEVRDYFVALHEDKHWSRPTITIALCGLKFCFEQTLGRQWNILRAVRPKLEKKLPVVLSREEVKVILEHVRLFRYRACLQTIYSCGLRPQEGTHLQIPDIDSARMRVHLRTAKGGKHRCVPLPQKTLQLLREQWKTHRNPVWIFPANGRGCNEQSTTDRPLPFSNVQDAFREARIEAGIHKAASVHTLPHGSAGRRGVSVRQVQRIPVQLPFVQEPELSQVW